MQHQFNIGQIRPFIEQFPNQSRYNFAHLFQQICFFYICFLAFLYVSYNVLVHVTISSCINVNINSFRYLRMPFSWYACLENTRNKKRKFHLPRWTMHCSYIYMRVYSQFQSLPILWMYYKYIYIENTMCAYMHK